jgi:hypothetical protein
VIILASLLVAWSVVAISADDDPADVAAGGDARAGDDVEVATDPTDTTVPPLPPFDGWVNPASSGRMWSETVPGILTFRGNPTRSFYGTGPMPANPQVLWSYPDEGGLCGQSTDGGGTSTWCGTGWTGQPSVWERDDRTWVSVRTTTASIGSTSRPAPGCSRASRPATSSRAR